MRLVTLAVCAAALGAPAAAWAEEPAFGWPVASPKLVVEDLAEALRHRDIELQLSVLGGMPHPTNLGADLLFSHRLSVGVTGGWFGVTSGQVRVVARNVEARLRWYPKWSWFNIGVTVGRDWLTADATVDADVDLGLFSIDNDVSVRIRIRRIYVAPNMGFDWNVTKGFTVGLQLGYQFPFAPWSSTDVDGGGLFGWVVDVADFLGLLNGLDQGVDHAAAAPVPYVVLRFQWNV
jgi:hypothetical protein